jgi:hypothetical protein
MLRLPFLWSLEQCSRYLTRLIFDVRSESEDLQLTQVCCASSCELADLLLLAAAELVRTWPITRIGTPHSIIMSKTNL